ncbi:MAG: hypothetical protein NE330_02600 [Lentisphaeraceae bacterium]|nr:hypothetical protein [Lentisphaeraceae bacterium]
MSLLNDFIGLPSSDLWQKFAEETGCEFEATGLLGNCLLTKKYKSYEIGVEFFIDTGAGVHTSHVKVKAAFYNPSRFKFRVFREGILGMLGKLIGVQDIKVGTINFDVEFMVQSNDKDKATQLLSDKRIQKMLHRQDQTFFEIRRNYGLFSDLPKNVDYLYFSGTPIGLDQEGMKQLYELFELTLDRLEEVGAISEAILEN